jgi:NAD+ synthase (glutamine-hydrolysing)
MLVTRAKDYSTVVAYCNLVGGQDELVFDGHSVIIGERGEILARAKGFEEDLLVSDINIDRVFRSRMHDPRRRKEQLTMKAHSDNAEVIVLMQKSGPPGSLLLSRGWKAFYRSMMKFSGRSCSGPGTM